MKSRSKRFIYILALLILTTALWGRHAHLPCGSEDSLRAMRETGVRSLYQEDPLGKGMAPHSSILTWRIPWTEEPGVYRPWDHKELGMTKWLTFSFSHIPLTSGKWIWSRQFVPIFLLTTLAAIKKWKSHNLSLIKGDCFFFPNWEGQAKIVIVSFKKMKRPNTIWTQKCLSQTSLNQWPT